MKEKKEYIIPDNVRSDFEIVQNVTVKDAACFLPVILIVIPICIMPISLYVKIPITTISLLFSIILVYLRPIRENIPFWQHVRELIRFSMREKVYYYRKEEYSEAAEMANEKRAKEAGAVSTAVHSHSRD